MIRTTYHYQVTQVKKRATAKGTMTTFSIKDEIKNADANKKNCWWSFVVWEDVDIADGDMITLDAIEGMSQTFFNAKTFINYYAKITKYNKEQEPEADYPDIDK